MRLKFWGVRGSIPTPGGQTARYGGNTSCVELRLEKGGLIILDAGTGIRNLGESLAESGQPLKASILITHPHGDHIQGFPFFRPAFIEGNELIIAGPEAADIPLIKLISGQMNKVYFPVKLSELKAEITFIPLREGCVRLSDAVVKAILVNHPGFTLGYRITADNRSLVYISDNEPYATESVPFFTNHEQEVLEMLRTSERDPNDRIVEFARGADVLIHDSTFTPELYRERVGWGHSHYLFALQIAAKARVKNLFLYHYDPSLTDAAIDDVMVRSRAEMERQRYSFRLHAAREGVEFQL